MRTSGACGAALAVLLLGAVGGCAPSSDPVADHPQRSVPADPEPDPDDEARGPLEPRADDESLPEDETDPQPVAPPSRTQRQSEGYPRRDDEPALLADARLIALPGIDRLVLEFAGQAPSFEIRETSPPILEQPGGQEVDLPGDSYVEIRLVPATSLEPEAAEPTAAYRGPTHLESDAPGLLEAVLTGDHGDRVVWSLGLAGEPGVAVAVLDDPARIVLDVVAGPA